jgi:hypothetical protein
MVPRHLVREMVPRHLPRYLCLGAWARVVGSPTPPLLVNLPYRAALLLAMRARSSKGGGLSIESDVSGDLVLLAQRRFLSRH